MRYLLQFLLTFLTFPHTSSQGGEVFFIPTLPAPGEDVTLDCSFFSSPNITFLSALPNFFIHSVTIGITAIRDKYTVNGVNLSRYTATISSSSSTRSIKANITLHNVTMQDEGIKMGCSAQTTFLSSLTRILSVNVSEPPLPIDPIRSTPLHPSTCFTTLYWEAPYSDRNIMSYQILRNQVTIHTNPSHLLSYDITDVPVGEVRSYRVIPKSVAGIPNGPSPALELYIPQFQFDEATLRVENGTGNYLNWTIKENYPDPLTVSYRLDLSEERVTKHSYAFSAGTDDNRYSFSGVDGNQFLLTLSAYRICDQSVDTSIRVGEEAADVATTSPDTVWIVTGSGGAFVLLWAVVLAVLSCVCCFPRRRRVTHI